MRRYLLKTGHVFSDEEKATIAANHLMMEAEKKAAWLESFCDSIDDSMLRDRIMRAVEDIRQSAVNGIPDSRSDVLFSYVYIPHDFRHEDIVRCMYGGWSTEPMSEKVGIILGYTDSDLAFCRKVGGDYSDAQVCVDVRFDGVRYMGEFAHEYINPIYIERLKLDERDERLPYLKYLINVHAPERLSIEKKAHADRSTLPVRRMRRNSDISGIIFPYTMRTVMSGVCRPHTDLSAGA